MSPQPQGHQSHDGLDLLRMDLGLGRHEGAAEDQETPINITEDTEMIPAMDFSDVIPSKFSGPRGHLRSETGWHAEAATSPQARMALNTENVVARVRENVRAFFDALPHDHNPSPGMWKALDDIPRTVCAILNGTAAPKYHLCQLDTGVGKSVTLTQTIRLLREHGNLDGQGVLICVARLDMIEPLIADLGVPADRIAVYVNDTEKHLCALGLGKAKADQADILVTTQAMVISRLSQTQKSLNSTRAPGEENAANPEIPSQGNSERVSCPLPHSLRVESNSLSRLEAKDEDQPPNQAPLSGLGEGSLKRDGRLPEGVPDALSDLQPSEGTRTHLGRSWAECDEFHYRGQPRVLRVWDETLLAGRPFHLSLWGLVHLSTVLYGARYHDLANFVRELSTELPKMPDGALVPTEDIEAKFGLNLATFLYALSPTIRDEIRDVAEALWGMSGNIVRVRNDGGSTGNVMLDYTETFPDDIKPLLVLDAGGRVRETYAQQDKHRRDIQFLKYEAKTYEKVTINVMLRGGGKDSFGKNYEGFIDRIADKINSFPNGTRTLVVHHLPSKTYKIKDVAADVRAKLDMIPAGHLDGKPMVRFVTWGQHDATNEFVDCTKLILAGTLFYSRSQNEAIARAASNIIPSRPYCEDDLTAISLGEQSNNLLQAGSRASSRLCDGSTARACDIYVIAAQNSGIKGALPVIFPGATINRWDWKSGEILAIRNQWRTDQFDVKLKQAFAKSGDEPVAAVGIYRAMDIDKSTFSRLMNSEAIQKFLRDNRLNYTCLHKRGRSKFFVKITPEFDTEQFPGPSREEVARAQAETDRAHREWHAKYDGLGRPRKRRDRNETPTYKPSYEVEPVYDDVGNYLG